MSGRALKTESTCAPWRWDKHDWPRASHSRFFPELNVPEMAETSVPNPTGLTSQAPSFLCLFAPKKQARTTIYGDPVICDMAEVSGTYINPASFLVTLWQTEKTTARCPWPLNPFHISSPCPWSVTGAHCQPLDVILSGNYTSYL